MTQETTRETTTEETLTLQGTPARTPLLIEHSARYADLTVADLLPFVDRDGRLEVRIEGEAARRPFAVLNLLRGAGFLHTHTWVEEPTADGTDGTDPTDAFRPVTLRVTAVLPERSAPRGSAR